MSAGLKPWKPYPAYKDSGVEWLGMVPEGWELKRLKHISEFVVGLTYSPEDITNSENGTLVLRSSNIQQGKISLDDSIYVNKEIPSKLITIAGDILICTRNGSRALIGKSAIIGSDLQNTSFGVFMTICRSQHFRYIHWVLNSKIFEFKSGSYLTSTINQLTVQNLSSFEIPFPPLPEQRAITTFLDQQCAQIDSLIEKKQRMLDLLDEKRRAVITQAVTRGLDPTVPLKDSGVEWLGQVPEGWKIGRVAFGYDIVLGKMLQPTPNSEKDIAVPYYRAMNVQWEKINSDLKVMWATPEEIRTFSVRQGDLLVCEGGEVGRAAIINLPVDEPTIIQNALHRVRAFKDCHVGYLLRVLEHVASADWFSVLCNKSTIAHFTGEKFKTLKCPLSPLPEQQAIADYLDAQCAAMDSQRKNLEKSIELLREYRASLITHAVTGKIDVRDVAPLQ